MSEQTNSTTEKKKGSAPKSTLELVFKRRSYKKKDGTEASTFEATFDHKGDSIKVSINPTLYKKDEAGNYTTMYGRVANWEGSTKALS